MRLSNCGFAWLDVDICAVSHEPSSFNEDIEQLQGVKIGGLEEAVLVQEFLTIKMIEALIEQMQVFRCREHLCGVADERYMLHGEV